MSEYFVGGLGRIVPPNFDHIAKYGYAAVAPSTPLQVEKVLVLPPCHKKHNQGKEGACVGHGTGMMIAIMNTIQCLKQGAKNPYIRYNPWWIWDEAKKRDQFPETNPGDNNGTTVSAACDVARELGLVDWPDEDDQKSFGPVNPEYGISVNRWATLVDEVRTAIAEDRPVAMGTTWLTDFDEPVYKNGEMWIGLSDNLGTSRGGHCTCIYGASDVRQAFKIKNSWGENYPEVWMPYKVVEYLIKDGGEFALVTDK